MSTTHRQEIGQSGERKGKGEGEGEGGRGRAGKEGVRARERGSEGARDVTRGVGGENGDGSYRICSILYMLLELQVKI